MKTADIFETDKNGYPAIKIGPGLEWVAIAIRRAAGDRRASRKLSEDIMGIAKAIEKAAATASGTTPTVPGSAHRQIR